eukprot:1158918-Pelagomonas_calceolata.AAC.14
MAETIGRGQGSQSEVSTHCRAAVATADIVELSQSAMFSCAPPITLSRHTNVQMAGIGSCSPRSTVREAHSLRTEVTANAKDICANVQMAGIGSCSPHSTVREAHSLGTEVTATAKDICANVQMAGIGSCSPHSTVREAHSLWTEVTATAKDI